MLTSGAVQKHASRAAAAGQELAQQESGAASRGGDKVFVKGDSRLSVSG
jgi:hypothetical protein